MRRFLQRASLLSTKYYSISYCVPKTSTTPKMMIERLLVPKDAYPQAERDEKIVQDYHGTKVLNPYQSLEDPDNVKTEQFVDQLNKISTAYINQCPIKDKIRDSIKSILDYPKYSCPQKEGNYYFYSHNTGLQNQSVLYKQDRLDGEPTVFIDPNVLSDDGTVCLSQKSFTEDGSLLAYGLSGKGSDWVTVKFKRTVDGSDLPDVLEKLRYSCLAWTRDNKGLFYNRYPDTCTDATGREATKNEFHQLYYHHLGTDQKDDILCAKFDDHPDYMIGAEVTKDGQFLVVSVDKGCDPSNLVYYFDLKSTENGLKEKLDLTPVIDQFEAKFDFIDNEGYLFTFLTDYEAPLFKLIQVDIRKPAKENWKVLIKESKNKLDWACRVYNDYLILCYIEDVKSVMRVHDFKSGKHLFELPVGIGSVTQFSGKKRQSEIFYAVQSFLSPGVIYRLDLTEKDKVAKVYREIKASHIDPKDFEVKQVFYESKDNTRIPMFIYHKKNLDLNGQNPTILYGYGGFNVSLLPTFRGCGSFGGAGAFFAHHFNGVVAVANLRGGDEYGKKWHEDGMKDKKQNVFDDFVSAAEYLIRENYTSTKKLAIEGHSNGGLLVAACLNQRPDLFGCVLAHVGVMDMLRYHLFTIGGAWIPEFGSSEVKEDFEHLIKYSPLHNLQAPVRDDPYPAVLLTTADHDDRVVPSHSLKFIAEAYHLWRHFDQPRLPFLARVEVRAGHGSGKPISKLIDEGTDCFSFLYNVLNLKWSE